MKFIQKKIAQAKESGYQGKSESKKKKMRRNIAVQCDVREGQNLNRINNSQYSNSLDQREAIGQL